MFYPVKMQKVRIIVIKSLIDEVVKRLHELGLVEISILENEQVEKGIPLERHNEISQYLIKIRGIKNSLEKYTSKKPTLDFIPNPVEEAKNINIDEQLKNLEIEKDQIQNDLARIKSELQITELFLGFKGIDFSRLNTRLTTSFVGEINRESLNLLKNKLENSKLRYKFDFILHQNKAIILLLYERSDGEKVEDILESSLASKLELPVNLTIAEKYKLWLERERTQKFNRLFDIEKQIKSIAAWNYSKICSIERALTIEADRNQISSRFGSTKMFYFIQGWIRKSDYSKLESELNKYNDRINLEKLETGSHETQPTILENPQPTKQFQFLTQTYGLPNSLEMDPTLLYFISIPLLYGMIVGDVVYGLISLVLAYWLNKKFSKSTTMSNITKIWLFSAIPAIFFGLIFDEWAGLTHLHLLELLEQWGAISLHTLGIYGHLYTGFSRAHNLPLLLGITLLIGLIHIGLGFVLGAISEWSHSKKHAAAKIFWLLIEIGGFVAIGGFLFGLFSTQASTYGVYLIGISAIGLFATEGVVGILEIPGLAGNVLSYLRIGVVGVVGVIIAEIINQFFIPLPSQGILSIIFFVLFTILHILNAFIAMFEALIQGGRLNLLEFKSKFVKGGGKLFTPFSVDN